MKSLLPSILLLALPALGAPGEVPLAWDASPTIGVTNYVLYASTNALTATNLANSPVKVNVGTNLNFIVEQPKPGLWWFTVTAQKGGLESGPSNVLAVEVPTAPAAMRTIAVQYSATLTNGFIDTGFFRLRIGTP